MIIIPSANTVTPSTSSAQDQRAATARERAIAMLSGNQANAQSAPVSNASKIAPEETAAIQKDTTVETTPPAVEAKAEEISPQLAQLIKKEKAARAEAAKLKLERDELVKAKEADREASFHNKLAEAEKAWQAKLAARLGEDPLTVLNENGLSYDALTEKLLNAPKPEDAARDNYTKKLESRLAELEAKQERQAKTFEENQSAQYNQAVSQIRSDVTQLVTNDPEFETIKSTGSINDVVELIEKTFKADGVLLTVEDAAKAVEDHLVEEYLAIMTKTSKLQKRYGATQAPKQVSSEKLPESSKQPQGSKTLTNNMSSTRPLTSRERALLAFEGKLK